MWKEPLTKFGLVHNVFIVIAVMSIIVGVYFGYKFSGENNARKRDFIPCVFAIILIIMEVFKIIFGLCIGYPSTSLIPFQICSLPMYFLPLLYVFKKGIIKDILLGFNGYAITLAGIAYFVNPSAMLQSKYIVLSLHSGIYHAIIVGVCIFVFVSNNLFGKKGILKFLKGFALFVVCTWIAMIANYITHQINPNSSLNLFYLYPVETETFPVIDKYVRPNVPYFIYYLSFIISYFVLSFVPYTFLLIVEIIKNKIQRSDRDEFKEA